MSIDEMQAPDVNESQAPSEPVEEPSEESSQEASESEGDTGSSESSAGHEQSVPYERFKEVNQKLRDMEAKLASLEKPAQQAPVQQPATTKEQAKAREYLKQIEEANPEFAGDLKSMLEAAEQVQELKAQLEKQQQVSHEREVAEIQKEANDRLSQLYKDNSVPDELQDIYRSQIEQAAAKGSVNSWEDFTNAFNSVHQTMSKFLDTQKRETLKDYAKAKKSDSVPTNKTTSPDPDVKAQKEAAPVDVEELKAQIAKNASSAWRQSNQT